MIYGQWFQRKISFKNWPKLHKISHNSMKKYEKSKVHTNDDEG